MDLTGLKSIIYEKDAKIHEEMLYVLNRGLLKEAIALKEPVVLGPADVTENVSLRAKEFQFFLWDALLRTALDSGVTGIQLTAACNAICGFLEASLESASSDLRLFAQSESTWFAVFDLYLLRHGDGKSKVMIQILGMLFNILSRSSNTLAAESTRRNVSKTLLGNVLATDSTTSLKQSIVALDFFIRKKAFSADFLLGQTSSVLSSFHVSHDGSQDRPADMANHQESYTRTEMQSLEDGNAVHQNTFCQVFAAIIMNCCRPDLIPSTAKLLSSWISLFESISTTQDSRNLPPWIPILADYMVSQPQLQQDMKIYLLPVIFKGHNQRFLSFLQYFGQPEMSSATWRTMPQSKAQCFLFVLEAGKALGLVKESGTMDNSRPVVIGEKDVKFSNTFLRPFLCYADSGVRLSAVSLVITSPQITAPFSLGSLSMLRESLFYNHSDPNPEVRGTILSLERRLLIRIRGIISALKQVETLPSQAAIPSSRETLLIAHVNSLEWYISAIVTDMGPSAIYQRHVTALKAFIQLLQSGLDKTVPSKHLSALGKGQLAWPIHLPLFSKSIYRVLLDLLLDPFDDIRSYALSALKMAPSGANSPVDLRGRGFIVTALSRAEQLACQTGRASHADCVARLYDLLVHYSIGDSSEPLDEHDDYQSTSQIMNQILGHLEEPDATASSVQGLYKHGYLAALRYIVLNPDISSLLKTPQHLDSMWRKFHERCMAVCFRIWSEVKPPLCIDSPEGQTDDELDYDLGIGPKDQLSASWRALREASLLLDAMLLNPAYTPISGNLRMTYTDFQRIGDLCFLQLAELRHRGAFSTVSQTFADCCHHCEHAEDPEIGNLPKKWLHEALIIIGQQASNLTRRSAGIPSIVTGIITANPRGHLFQIAIDNLVKLAWTATSKISPRDENRLPQVHALNCLKDIVTNSKLGSSTEPFLIDLVQLSVHSIESDRWAIRNCGLMLLRALISRLCQSSHSLRNKSEDSNDNLARISFDKFPRLDSILTKLLEPSIRVTDSGNGPNTLTAEKIFVALELVRRRDSPSDLEPRLLQLLIDHFENSNWSIREQAAKAYASQTRHEKSLAAITYLLTTEWNSANALHGALLAARFIMWSTSSSVGSARNDSARATPTGDIMKVLLAADSSMFRISKQNCPHTSGIFWDIVSESLECLTVDDADMDSITTKKSYEAIKDPDTLKNFHTVFSNANEASSKSFLTAGKPYIRFLCLWWSMKGCVFDDTRMALKAVLGSYQGPLPAILYKLLLALDFPQEFCELVLASRMTDEARAEAMENATDILLLYARSTNNKMLSGHIFANFEQLVIPLISETEAIHGRNFCDLKLRVEGVIFALQYVEFDIDIARIKRWIAKIRLAGHEQNEFSTRRSAVQSLAAFHCIVHFRDYLPSTEPFLDLYLALYDLLNDDDEDIRNEGAETVSYILAERDSSQIHEDGRGYSPPPAHSPLAASQQLLYFLALKYASSHALARESIRRITDQSHSLVCDKPLEPLRPVQSLLSEKRKVNTDLFAEERQNLFIDDVREVEVWSNLLGGLHVHRNSDARNNAIGTSSSSSITTSLSDLARWTSDGIRILAEFAASAADGSAGLDGSLGWTTTTNSNSSSNPDVFCLGLRVLHSARCLHELSVSLSCRQGGSSSSLKTRIFDNPVRDALRKNLRDFLEKASLAQVNDQWLRVAETVLKRLDRG